MSNEPRRPGQSNDDYHQQTGRGDGANAKFLGTHSLQGGGDPGWTKALWRAIFDWPEKRRARRRAKKRSSRS